MKEELIEDDETITEENDTTSVEIITNDEVINNDLPDNELEDDEVIFAGNNLLKHKRTTKISEKQLLNFLTQKEIKK